MAVAHLHWNLNTGGIPTLIITSLPTFFVLAQIYLTLIRFRISGALGDIEMLFEARSENVDRFNAIFNIHPQDPNPLGAKLAAFQAELKRFDQFLEDVANYSSRI